MVLAKFDDGTGFHLQFVSKIGVSPSEPDSIYSFRAEGEKKWLVLNNSTPTGWF
jgi:hypothetical protein